MMDGKRVVEATGRVIGTLAKKFDAEQKAVRDDIAGLRELAFDLKSQIATVKDIAEARGDHVARLALEQSELIVRSGEIAGVLGQADSFAEKVKSLEALAVETEARIADLDRPVLARAFSDDGRLAFEALDGRIVKSEIELEGLRGRPGADRPIVAPMVAREGVKYERHSVVCHKGGLAIAARDTIGGPAEDPDAFVPIVRGIERVEAFHDPDDPREVSIALQMSDGKSETIDLAIGGVRFRNAWADGGYWRRDDMVQHSRGLWIATEDTEAEPGKSDSWRLALKLPKGDKGDKGDTVKGDPGASIASIVFDEETKAFVFGTSDGEAIAVPVEKAAPFDSTTPGLSRYRGVYDAGTAYDQGDVVTRGQALIVAKRAVPAGADPRLAENFDTMIDAGAFMPQLPVAQSDWNRQRALTQAQFDAIESKDPLTFYAILE